MTTPKALTLAAGAGFVVFWSCGFIGARWGTQYTSAFDLLAWRFLVAGAIAAAVLAVRRPRISRRDLATQISMAFLTQFVYLGLIFTGIDHGITAGVTALIGSLQPLLIATVAGPLLGERVSRRQWLGLVLGLVGVGAWSSPMTSGPVMGHRCCSCSRSAASSVSWREPASSAPASRVRDLWMRWQCRVWCRLSSSPCWLWGLTR
jgi:uncharacterized membrane protein